MDLFDALAQRYSYRGGYRRLAAKRADLRKIMESAIRAPSGCNAQTTSFVAVDDPALIAQISTIVDRPTVREAAALIFCVMDTRAVYREMSFGVEDCAAAAENIWLAITALGYASVWLDGVLRVEGRAEKIGALLGVPAGQSVRILMPVGVPTEPGTPRDRLPFEKRAFFNHWGQDS